MSKIFSFLDAVFRFFLHGLILLGLLGVTGIFVLFFFFSRDIPQIPSDLQAINLSIPTEIYSDDNVLLASFGSRSVVPLEKISPTFQKAIVAVEDSRFYQHGGIDPLGIARALIRNLKSGRKLQGGSTITQQLAKNLFFSFAQSYKRKVYEAMAAVQIEAMFSKEDILEAYSNQIYFGSGAYGIEDASKRFFGKSAQELNLAEASLLAGLPNAPSAYNPFHNYKLSKKRQWRVLKRMTDLNIITPAEAKKAFTEELHFAEKSKKTRRYPYFIDYVLAEAEKVFGKDALYYGGLKIYTTLDRRLQEVAQKNVTSQTERISNILKKPEMDIQAAATGVEPRTGFIRFMVGGKDYQKSPYNRAITRNRQPGSGFKPFVYFSAINSLGLNPSSIVRDEEVTFEINGAPDWTPHNFENEFQGDIILKYALMKSINIVSAKLVEKLTPQKVISTVRRFGVKAPIQPNLSIALGTFPVSCLEMASAYAVFASEGLYAPPVAIKRIESYSGDVLLEHIPRPSRSFPAKEVYQVVDMMKGVIEAGTGRSAKRYGLRVPAGGKTGTTNNFVDAWFNGYTPDLSVSVWLGDDHNQPMTFMENRGITGASGALPIWSRIMVAATEGKAYKDFPVPPEIHFERVDIHTGQIVDSTDDAEGNQEFETLRVALADGAQPGSRLEEPPEENEEDATTPEGFLLDPPLTPLPDFSSDAVAE